MTPIAANLQAVIVRICDAARAAGRDPASIRLLAVSKTHSAETVRLAAACGQRAFGENYVQEAVDKVTALQTCDLEWHFIGPIQSNKTRLLAASFDWVHSVDRLKIAQRLSAQRPSDLPPLNVCIQVNVSGETSKSGVTPHEIAPLVSAVSTLPGLALRGLMTIPEPTDNTVLQRERFASLRRMRDELIKAGYALDTLSMGMSDDLEAAIAEGATIVRVGSAIFGSRSARAAGSG